MKCAREDCRIRLLPSDPGYYCKKHHKPSHRAVRNAKEDHREESLPEKPFEVFKCECCGLWNRCGTGWKNKRCSEFCGED